MRRAGGLTRVSAFTYFTTTNGLLESETVEPDVISSGDPVVRSLYLKTTYAYDAFGNKQSATVQSLDHGSRTSSVQFDAIGRFPDTQTNALGHVVDVAYHDWWGTVVSQTDVANNLTVTFEFDAFGRVKKETRPDNTISEVQRRWVGGNAPADALYYVESTATGAAPAIEFFDAFGRVIRKLGVDADGYAVAADTEYDSLGRAFKTSSAFRTIHSPVAWTEVKSYDVLNRPIVVVTPDEEVTAGSTALLPDGTSSGVSVPAGTVATTYQYNARVARVRNPRGLVTRTTTNGQGWEIEVVQNETNLEFDAGSDEQTTLTKVYDAQGNLEQTTTAGSTIENFYDVRGRRVATDDPDMGVWSYQYNGFGELIEQLDAKNQKTTHEYDVLGRPTLRHVNTASYAVEETTQWTYHGTDGSVPAGSRGRLDYVETKAGNETVLFKEDPAYDSLGRLVSTTRTIPDAEIPNPVPATPLAATAYTVTLGYDSAGRLETTTYPTGFATHNVYNAFGALKEVRRSDAGRNDVFWMAQRDPENLPLIGVGRFVLGNGVTTDRTVSKATGRLRDISSGVRNGWGLQQIAYNYDVLANVATRGDAVVGLIETAAYDGLNRLMAFYATQGAALTDVSLDYAANGNITQKSGVGAYTYGGPRPHAVTAAGGNTYTYDANGGLENGASRSVQWTAFNQIRRIDQGGSYSEFWFGAGHERVGQASHRGRTIYVGGLYEKFTPSGSGPVEHWHWIMTPAGRIAVHKTFSSGSPVTRYFHHDALGSITVVTNESGGMVERFRYDAWGKRLDSSGQPVLWSNNDGITRGFTDHEHLDDLGLVHMNGRIYDPVLGRFLSADPFIDGTSDSQGFNRYSYVANNPLNATDPSGYLKLKEILPAIIAVVVTAVVTVFTFGGAAAFSSFSSFFGTLKAAAVAAGSFSASGLGAAAAGGFWGGFASGFSGSLLNGGSIGDAFQAGVVGGVVGGATALLSAGIGHVIGGAELGAFEDWLARVAGHGTVGGLASEAQGGEFRHGFYSSAASTGFMHSRLGQRLIGNSHIAVRTATAAVVGGTASTLGGGKFANGAVTATFQHLFNAETSRENTNATGFDTRDEAAIAALKVANPVSIRENVEYGGIIYLRKGRYYFTTPIRGEKDSINLKLVYEKLVPRGAMPVADFHTHGDYSDESGNRVSKAHDYYNSDHWSKEDRMAGSSGWYVQVHSGVSSPDWVRFLGTPSGTFRKYYPERIPPMDDIPIYP